MSIICEANKRYGWKKAQNGLKIRYKIFKKFFFINHADFNVCSLTDKLKDQVIYIGG